MKDAKVLIKSKTKLLGAEAVDITLSYLGLDKPYSTDAKLIAMKERMIICQKADAFYFLRYENTEARYPEFEKAFGHIAKSVRFQAVR